MYTKEACPLEVVVGLTGGKWKMILLYHLFEKGTVRYGELSKAADGITQRMLTAQLRALEADGLIMRKVYPVVPPKVEYSLTPYGQTLGPVILAMKKWGIRHLQNTVTTTE